MTESSAAAPALAAFLRGVERRGAVFAELQCGDVATGEAALVAALRAFRNHAAHVPMAEWPQRFWRLLLATPQLRTEAAGAAWPAPMQALAGIAPDCRASLLLRLAAGLDETDAAAVQGLDQDGYRRALAEACPRDADGQPDALAWRALGEAIQRHLRELPPQRHDRLAQLRDAALAETPRPQSAGQDPARAVPEDRPVRRRRHWIWLVLLLLAGCLLVAAVIGYRGWRGSAMASGPAAIEEEGAPDGVFPLADTAEIVREDLPPVETPSVPVAVDPSPMADDAGADAQIVRIADLLAWFDAGGEVETTTDATAAAGDAAIAGTAAIEAGADAASPDQAGWRAAWQGLDEAERTRLRDAASRFAALPLPQQRAWRARFDSLDMMRKRGWRLGPTLGMHYAELHSLLAFVPPAQSQPLLAVLKSLSPDQRADLAELAQRTPPQQRDALRSDLLAAPASQRGEWLRKRLQE